MFKNTPWAIDILGRASRVREETRRVIIRSRDTLERNRKLLDQAESVERHMRDLLAMAATLDIHPRGGGKLE
jgi:hypothetical protein